MKLHISAFNAYEDWYIQAAHDFLFTHAGFASFLAQAVLILSASSVRAASSCCREHFVHGLPTTMKHFRWCRHQQWSISELNHHQRGRRVHALAAKSMLNRLSVPESMLAGRLHQRSDCGVPQLTRVPVDWERFPCSAKRRAKSPSLMLRASSPAAPALWRRQDALRGDNMPQRHAGEEMSASTTDLGCTIANVGAQRARADLA